MSLQLRFRDEAGDFHFSFEVLRVQALFMQYFLMAVCACDSLQQQVTATRMFSSSSLES